MGPALKTRSQLAGQGHAQRWRGRLCKTAAVVQHAQLQQHGEQREVACGADPAHAARVTFVALACDAPVSGLADGTGAGRACRRPRLFEQMRRETRRRQAELRNYSGAAGCPHSGPMPSRAGPKGTLASTSSPFSVTRASSPLVPRSANTKGRGVARPAGRQPRAHVAAHKGAGQRRNIDRRQIRQTDNFVAAVADAIGRGAQARHVAIQKNIGHGRVGRQTYSGNTAAVRAQRGQNPAQSFAHQPGQQLAAAGLAGHSQPRHDVRPGPGLGIQKMPLRHARFEQTAVRSSQRESAPVDRCGAQIHGQDKFRLCRALAGRAG